VYQANVVKSDTAVSSELKQLLQEAVNKFEVGIPEKLKDWHPGSDDKVWDLVHPSLFPLIYGRSRVLENGETTTLHDCIQRCGQGRITNVPPLKRLTKPAGTIIVRSQSIKFTTRSATNSNGCHARLIYPEKILGNAELLLLSIFNFLDILLQDNYLYQ